MSDSFTRVVRRGLGTLPRTMISKPIDEGSLLPPYGTIIGVRGGRSRAMIVGRASMLTKMAVVMLNEGHPQLRYIPDIALLKNWEILQEAQ